ncbi:MAG: aminopeptidase [Kiritimatiellae bacterium]|nr:aminopeptidase [Kiritimatiellia bacterium]
MYTPPKKILENYSKIFVNFALNAGKGIRKGDVVYLATQLPGLPLAKEIYRTILLSGGFPLIRLLDDDFQLIHYQVATETQLTFFPEKSMKGLADQIDQWIRILAYEDPLSLKHVDPRKIMLSINSAKKFRDWLDRKEDEGRFTWTLGLYGTLGSAREAGLTEKEYWGQIIKACFLDEKDPVGRWKKAFATITKVVRWLDDLPIDRLHVRSQDTDLRITLGQKRKWLGGSGRNIPSFEIFTSPDWRGTEGKIRFKLPLYRYGNLLKDIRLEFRNGRVVHASAGQNEKFLKQMLAQKNADKIGEFSLTDKRLSRITKFMANSLYDENYGGRFGNIHIAMGKSYHDTYTGNAKRMTNADWEKLGFNSSPEHTDIIATDDRTVTAYLKGGNKKVIYEGGEFAV